MKVLEKKGVGNVRRRKYCLLAASLSCLCACGVDSKHESERQVVAKVNGLSITSRELNDQFSRIASRAGPGAKVGKKQVLDALVDEKLLMQRAIEDGLDREPETIAALDRARRQVLAQAAIAQATQGGQVGAGEVKGYYESHPDLFERRRNYVFRRFDLLTGELSPAIKAELGKAGSPMGVASILKRASVAYKDQTEIRPAETLPVEILKQAAEMQRGDILLFKEAGQIVLMQLTTEILEPVDFGRAAPAIRAFLADSRRKRAAELLLKDLRQGAKIDYPEGMIDGIQVQADAGSFEAIDKAPVRKSNARLDVVNPSR